MSSSEGVCSICGCDELHACVTDEGPCSWILPNLCSACAIELPPGQNFFSTPNIALIVPKKCENCDHLASREMLGRKKDFSCSEGRFVVPGAPSTRRWYAWTGIKRPNTALRQVQKQCPLWKVHHRFTKEGRDA